MSRPLLLAHRHADRDALRRRLNSTDGALLEACGACGGRGGEPRSMFGGDRQWDDCRRCVGTGMQADRDVVCIGCLDEDGQIVPAVEGGACAACLAERAAS